MAHGHKIVKCSNCGNVVSQCRCPELDKLVELVDSCDRCEGKRIKLQETAAQQRQRLTEKLSADIIKIQERLGEQAVGLAVFNWLVEALIKLEALELKQTTSCAIEHEGGQGSKEPCTTA